jgi:hypothetical protein
LVGNTFFNAGDKFVDVAAVHLQFAGIFGGLHFVLLKKTVGDGMGEY